MADVWVEPEHRTNAIGAALVRAAADRARKLDFDPVYLWSLPLQHGFYERLGWRPVEVGVTEAGLAVFRSP